MEVLRNEHYHVLNDQGYEVQTGGPFRTLVESNYLSKAGLFHQEDLSRRDRIGYSGS